MSGAFDASPDGMRGTLVSWGWAGTALRAVVLVAVVDVVAVTVALGDPSRVLLAATALSGFLAVRRVDSAWGAVLLACLILHWLVAVPAALLPWSLVLAFGVLLSHVCLAKAATLPPQARLGRGSLRVWLRDCGVVAGATVAVWALVQGLAAVQRPGAVLVTATAAVLLVVGALLLRSRSLEEPRAAPGSASPR